MSDGAKRVGYFEWWVMSNEWWVMSDGNWVMKKNKPNKALGTMFKYIEGGTGNLPIMLLKLNRSIIDALQYEWLLHDAFRC